MHGMKRGSEIRLDDRALADAALIMQRYNLRTLSAAVRLALRELARQLEQQQKED